MIIKKELVVNAPATILWSYLTEGEKTQQYMYGCKIVSDWEVGSPVLWIGLGQDGQEMIYMQGHLLEYKHQELLRITLFDPNMGIADVPDNYLEMTYVLQAKDDQTILHMEQRGFDRAEKGPQRYEDSLVGWASVLQQIKGLAEKQASELT